MKKLILISTTFLLMFSCSSNQSKIENKWWFEISKYGDDIIMFHENGTVENINDNGDAIYTIEGEQITISEGKNSMTFGISIDNDLLTMTKEGDSKTFKLCEEKDLLVGSWKGLKNDKKVKMKFNKKNEVTLKIDGQRKEDNYTIKGNSIIVEKEESTFSLSKDKNTLTIVNGDESLILNRY